MKECPNCKLCFDDEVNYCPHDNAVLFISHQCRATLGERYILEKRIGKGGMGSVFKGKHRFLKSAHAIKIISPEVVREDESLLVRFRQEAILAASIHHPNIVTVTDFGIENQHTLYLVMEYIEGFGLDTFLGRGNFLSVPQALQVITAIGRGVSAAHGKGIIHRDLKPLNVMLRSGYPISESVKVLDFGLAKIKSTESFASLVQAETTNMLGSPHYMSPEQWANEGVDNRSDIYSMGIMLFQMLTGEVPFKGNTIPSVMYQHLQSPVPPLERFGIHAPPVEEILQKALAKQQKDRYPNVEDFLVDCENALFQQLSQSKKSADFTVEFNNTEISPSSQTVNFDQTDFFRKQTNPKDSDKTFFSPDLDSSKNQGVTKYIDKSKTLSNLENFQSDENLAFSAKNAEKKPVEKNVSSFNLPNHLSANNNYKLSDYLLPAVFGLCFLAVLATIGYLYFNKSEKTQATAEPALPAEKTFVSQPANNSNMIFIDSGSFFFGRNDAGRSEKDFSYNQFPAEQTTVRSFYIDKTEVTNREYSLFVNETRRQPPKNWEAGQFPSGRENFPVTFVSYQDAVDFAKWRTVREGKICQLPSEVEWEYVARNGNLENIYPWGNDWHSEYANLQSNTQQEVGKSQDVTSAGVQDMLGNVMEWTSTEYNLYPKHPAFTKNPDAGQTVRGGHFKILPEQEKSREFLLTGRAGAQKDLKRDYLGFRLICYP